MVTALTAESVRMDLWTTYEHGPGDLRDPDDWVDVMQVCRRGHRITASFIDSPQGRRAFCPECGEPTLVACENSSCRAPIVGARHISNVLRASVPEPPNRCGNCGSAFPWTESTEGSRLQEILTEYGRLCDADQYVYALPRLAIEVGAAIGPLRSAKLCERSLLLGAYSQTVRALFRQHSPVPSLRIPEYVSAQLTIVRELESCAEEAARLLSGMKDRTAPAFALFGKFQVAANESAARFEAVLRALGREVALRRIPPPSEIPHQPLAAGVEVAYGPGDSYSVYKDLSGVVASAKRSVFVADTYANEEVFDLLLSKLPAGVTVRVLTMKPQDNFEAIAKRFAKTHAVEARRSTKFHDRCVFVDDRAFVMGQSFKDAAGGKPTYLVELESTGPSLLRDYDAVWTSANVIPTS